VVKGLLFWKATFLDFPFIPVVPLFRVPCRF
jgi:hypothetical protein